MTQVAADATSQTTTYRRDECAIFMRSRDKHGDLSNMTFGFPLLMNQVRFQGPEGLYQSLKFPHRPHHQLYIAQQRSGMDAKRAAYEIDDARPDWDEVRVTAMACTLAVKLSQHPRRFAHALLATGTAPIIVMSRRDAFWGAVPDGDIGRATTLTVEQCPGKDPDCTEERTGCQPKRAARSGPQILGHAPRRRRRHSAGHTDTDHAMSRARNTAN